MSLHSTDHSWNSNKVGSKKLGIQITALHQLCTEVKCILLDLNHTDDAIGWHNQIHLPCGIKPKQGGFGDSLLMGKKVLLTRLQNKAEFQTSLAFGSHHMQ